MELSAYVSGVTFGICSSANRAGMVWSPLMDEPVAPLVCLSCCWFLCMYEKHTTDKRSVCVHLCALCERCLQTSRRKQKKMLREDWGDGGGGGGGGKSQREGRWQWMEKDQTSCVIYERLWNPLYTAIFFICTSLQGSGFSCYSHSTILCMYPLYTPNAAYSRCKVKLKSSVVFQPISNVLFFMDCYKLIFVKCKIPNFNFSPKSNVNLSKKHYPFKESRNKSSNHATNGNCFLSFNDSSFDRKGWDVINLAAHFLSLIPTWLWGFGDVSVLIITHMQSETFWVVNFRKVIASYNFNFSHHSSTIDIRQLKVEATRSFTISNLQFQRKKKAVFFKPVFHMQLPDSCAGLTASDEDDQTTWSQTMARKMHPSNVREIIGQWTYKRPESLMTNKPLFLLFQWLK